MREFDLERTIWDVVVDAFYNGLYYYSLFIMSSYLILSLISFLSVRKYLQKSTFVNYKDILNTPIAPSVSLLAPAYNESETIIENIRSLLSIHYSEFEVIIINDGSKDDTLAKCIAEYQLEKVDFAVNNQIPTKEIRGVYKSRNRSFQHLLLVDKENGGKSDALNAGINVSSFDYITCIDVDCVLEQDALLKLMKPFVDQTDEEVIATGGVIRIANSCIVENGRLMEVKVPKNFLARTQTLEYIRAFLLGRMAWSHLDGLILISGALGVFKKKIAIEVGGYDKSTVGEDMELVVRMRRFMREKKRPYQVAYIPDPLCWTEAPESWKILGRQRNRWTRGTIETLWKHKKMFFNPIHGRIAFLSYPYWFFFEWLAPLLEAFGITLFLLFAIVGLVNWSFFFLMIFLVYGFTISFSVLSLLIEEITYHQYKKHSDVIKLLQVGLLEPLMFHPFVVYSAVRGNIDYVLGKSTWGEMSRKGFAAQTGAKRIRIVQSVLQSASAVGSNPKVAQRLRLAATVIVLMLVASIAYYFLGTPSDRPVESYGYLVYQNAPENKEAVLKKRDDDKKTFFEKLFSKEEFDSTATQYTPIDDNPEVKLAEQRRSDSLEKLNPNPKTESISPKNTAPKEEKILLTETQSPSPKKDEEPKKTQVEEKPTSATQSKSTQSSPTQARAPKAVNQQPTKMETTNNGLVYHLVAGSYSDEKWANNRKLELMQKGFNAEVISTDDKYRVTFGSFASKTDAYELRDKLQATGEADGAWVLPQSTFASK